MAYEIGDVRTCGKCGVEHEHRGAVNSWCKPCASAYARKYQRKNETKFEPVRTCSLCNEQYDHYGQRSSWCRSCRRMKANEDTANRTDDQKLHVNDTARMSRRQKRQFVVDYLKDNPCACGERRIAALQFDHRDRDEKYMDVTSMVNRGYSIQKIVAEIEKCDVLCANCHSMRTAEQCNWYANLDKEWVHE